MYSEYATNIRKEASQNQTESYRISIDQWAPLQEWLLAALSALSASFCLGLLPLDFHFANGDSECLNQEITQFDIPFDLQMWLRVQAITMLVSTLALVPAFVVSCCSEECGVLVLGGCGMCYICLFGIFSLAWQIVGALMVWGDLLQTGTCNSDLTAYMWVHLILGFVSFSCGCSGFAAGGGTAGNAG